jgi:hypothetical protein
MNSADPASSQEAHDLHIHILYLKPCEIRVEQSMIKSSNHIIANERRRG